MIFQVLLLTSVAAAVPTADSFVYVDPNPSYSVAWEVKNEPTYDDKSQQETLQDGTVEGQYSYLRPDGKLQVVTYRANDEIGFVVNVDVQDVMPPFGAGGRLASADAAGNRGTLGQRRRKPVSNFPVVPLLSTVPNARTAFVRPTPVIQPAVFQPAAAVRRIPFQRSSAAAAQSVARSAFRSVSTAQSAFSPTSTAQRGSKSVPAIQPVIPRIATRRPPPPRPTITTSAFSS